jgi:hypothetical protein
VRDLHGFQNGGAVIADEDLATRVLNLVRKEMLFQCKAGKQNIKEKLCVLNRICCDSKLAAHQK